MATREVPFASLLAHVVDNRGRTCPTSHSGLPLIATNCISNSRLYPSYDTTRHVSAETYRTWFRGHPVPGDLIFVCKGSPGRVALVPDPIDFCIAQDMVAIRADPSRVYPRYLLAALRSPHVQSRIENMHVGTLIPHFKKGDFDKLLIPLPEPPIQAIAGDTYYELSEKIEQNRRTGRALERLARAVFKAWFVDFEPIKAKAAGSTSFPGMSRDTFAALPTFLVNSDLGPVPDGWEIRPLGEATSVLETGRRPKGGVKGIKAGVPSVGAESITRIGEYDFGKTKYVPEPFFNAMTKGVLSDGDVLLYKDGGRPGDFQPHVSMCGRGFPFERMCINEHVFRIRGRAPLTQSYLYLWLSADGPMEDMRRRGTGVAIPGLSAVAAKGINTLVPAEQVVLGFDTIVQPLLSLCLQAAAESRKLASLRDYLLPRLLSGEVRVGEAAQLTASV